jgi:hypothetical protein
MIYLKSNYNMNVWYKEKQGNGSLVRSGLCLKVWLWLFFKIFFILKYFKIIFFLFYWNSWLMLGKHLWFRYFAESNYFELDNVLDLNPWISSKPGYFLGTNAQKKKSTVIISLLPSWLKNHLKAIFMSNQY